MEPQSVPSCVIKTILYAQNPVLFVVCVPEAIITLTHVYYCPLWFSIRGFTRRCIEYTFSLPYDYNLHCYSTMTSALHHSYMATTLLLHYYYMTATTLTTTLLL